MAAANFLTKAMALPAPPPVPQLPLKGDWSEMNHAWTTASLHIPTPLPLAPLYTGKKSKRALTPNKFSVHNHENDADPSRSCPPVLSVDGGLSDEARRFLEEDPFDFDALPHPVLMRQQALCHVRDSMYGNTSEDDDDIAGPERISSAPESCNNPRWNASVMGASLAHAGRGWNVPLLTRSDGGLR